VLYVCFVQVMGFYLGHQASVGKSTGRLCISMLASRSRYCHIPWVDLFEQGYVRKSSLSIVM